MQNNPKHIAIIMDGNGRFAEKHGKPRWWGHQKGANAIEPIVKTALHHQIQVISLFAFSSENWSRPYQEIDYLMKLFSIFLKNKVKKLHSHEIRIKFIGDRSKLSDAILKAMYEAENLTSNNSAMTLVIAVNYGGQWDILQATRQITEEGLAGKILPENITSDLFSSYLSLHTFPDPDLLIRTSGEARLSNFFLWQSAYTEFYFTDMSWPEFNPAEFEKALTYYQARKRRFGKI